MRAESKYSSCVAGVGMGEAYRIYAGVNGYGKRECVQMMAGLTVFFDVTD